jgi:hypothetical protein
MVPTPTPFVFHNSRPVTPSEAASAAERLRAIMTCVT